jgi:hypothetical protein
MDGWADGWVGRKMREKTQPIVAAIQVWVRLRIGTASYCHPSLRDKAFLSASIWVCGAGDLLLSRPREKQIPSTAEPTEFRSW